MVGCTYTEESHPPYCFFNDYFLKDSYEKGEVIEISFSCYNESDFALYVDDVEMMASIHREIGGYVFYWNTRYTNVGSHTIKVVAIGVYENSISSEQITINITEPTPTLPEVTLAEVTDTTATSISCKGKIMHDGWVDITQKGMCWSTTTSPTIKDYITQNTTEVDSFVCTLSNLEPNTKYFIRSYATNSIGTSYSEEFEVTTKYEYVSDIDGNQYKVINIGDQTWLAQNLKTLKLNDGTPIPNVTTDTDWLSTSTSAYCWYENNEDYKETYGALYNWSTVMTNKLCPSNWHIPTDEEWKVLDAYFDANSNSSNEFSIVQSGVKYAWSETTSFYGSEEYSQWWSADEYNDEKGISWYAYTTNLKDEYIRKKSGAYVRCIKDK
jgi:hypothetical protein